LQAYGFSLAVPAHATRDTDVSEEESAEAERIWTAQIASVITKFCVIFIPRVNAVQAALSSPHITQTKSACNFISHLMHVPNFTFAFHKLSTCHETWRAVPHFPLHISVAT
jgi:hypothetical protein